MLPVVVGDDQVGDPDGADESLAVDDGQAPEPVASHVVDGVVGGVIRVDGVLSRSGTGAMAESGDVVDLGSRSEEAIDTGLHGPGVPFDRCAADEVEGFLTAEAGSGVCCSARSVTAGHH